MKLFIGHVLGFTMAFGICFIGFSAFAIFLPVISAFIFWDVTPLRLDSEIMFLLARLITLVSAFIALGFTCSKEGKEAAKEYVENGKWL